MDASIESGLQALSDGLDRGLFCDNLHPLIETAKDLVRRSEPGPVQHGAFTVESVLADLQEFWDGYPVSPAAYEQVNAELGPALKRVVRAMIRPDERLELRARIEDLIGRHVHLQVTEAVR